MQQFEYKIYRIERKSIWTVKVDFEQVTNDLNALGKKGWEIVSSIKT